MRMYACERIMLQVRHGADADVQAFDKSVQLLCRHPALTT